jgi:hypothetical protein
MVDLLSPTHFFIVLLILGMLSLGIVAIVFLYIDFDRVPPAFRKLDPGLVWLLLIPCFSIVWNFFVFPRLSDSFKAYFQSIGDESVGDCGRGLGLGYAITSAVAVVPILGIVAALVSLVLLVLYLVKANELKNRIPAGA